MPDYTFTAPNGKSIKVTGDTPPSETELDSIFKAAGVDTSGDTFSRRGGASSQAMVSAPDAAAEPDVVTLGELRDNPKAAMQRIGAILGKDATDPKLWLTLAASYLAPKVFSAAAPVVARAAQVGRAGMAEAAPSLVRHGATAAGAYLGGPTGAIVGRTVGDSIAGRMVAPPPEPIGPVSAPGFPRGSISAATDPAPSPAPRAPVTGTSMVPAPMPTLRAAPAPEPVQPSPAPEPAPPVARGPVMSEQMAKNQVGLVARRAGVRLAESDLKPLVEDVQAGTSPADAVAKFAAEHPEASPDPAAELARRLGTPSDAERTFPPNKSGLPTKSPTARKARGRIADLADMPK